MKINGTKIECEDLASESINQLGNMSFINKSKVGFDFCENSFHPGEYDLYILWTLIEITPFKYKIDKQYSILFDYRYEDTSEIRLEVKLCHKGYEISTLLGKEEKILLDNIQKAIEEYGDIYDKVIIDIEKTCVTLNKKYLITIELIR